MRFECWKSRDEDGVELTFAPATQIAEMRERKLLDDGATLVYAFEAATWFDAMTEHHKRQGWQPYTPGRLPNGYIDESVFEPL